MQTTDNRPANGKLPIVSVSQVTQVVSSVIKDDWRLRNVAVRGELSNFTNHYKTGHFYFTLKDEHSQLKAVMFSDYARRVRFAPKNGDKVIVAGAITVYEPSGVYQISCTHMKLEGEGEQSAALAELKQRLLNEGLFSQKRRIPPMPKKIAVVTSAEGAALQDIINIVSRRYPVVTLVVIPTLVQGVNAPESIAAAIGKAQQTDADTLIFGRGGGSAEELGAFNTEIVARAIYNSRIPTISAVGHQTDVTIADLAADMRVPTPSAAAELAVPDGSMLLSAVDGLERRIRTYAKRCIGVHENALSYRSQLIRSRSPRNRINMLSQRLESMSASIHERTHAKLERSERQLTSAAEMISALNPLAILVRGYSVTYRDGAIVTDSAQLNKGDEVEIRLAKGSACAEITQIKED